MAKVTIQDIADELGLSRNTVSKALNQAEGIAESTRALVFAKAAEMGYKQFAFLNASELGALELTTPVKRMQRVAPGSPNEVALVTGSYIAPSHFATPTLDALQRELSNLGYTLNTHRVNEADVAAGTLPPTLQLERVASIVCVEVFDRAYAEMLCGLGLPILFMDGPALACQGNLPADQLYMNNTSEVAHLVGDVIKAGKRRIGFVGNHLHCQSFFERYVAYLTAMTMNGAAVEERFCIASNDFYEVERRLDEMNELPDLFLCANDFIALDLLLALRNRGYDVPRDVWLAGFDDSAESRRSMPPLTTVHIHTQGMAYMALDLLSSRAEEPTMDYRQVYVASDLIYRASTPLA